MILKTLLNWLTGNVLGTLERLYIARQKAKTDEARLAVEEQIALLKARQAVLIAEQGWWVTAWIRPLFAYPLIVWWAAVIMDSLFQFPWDVAALPAPLDEWAGWIVAAYFLGRSVEKSAKAIARRSIARR